MAKGLCMLCDEPFTLDAPHSCKGFSEQLQQLKFTSEMMTLPWRCCNLILEAQWLSTTEPVIWVFSKLPMEFSVEGAKSIERGIKPSSSNLINTTSFTQGVQQGGQLYFLYMDKAEHSFEIPFCSLASKGAQAHKLPAAVEDFIMGPHDIFDDSTHLLLYKAGFDHIVPLMEVYNPFKLGSYRYSNIQNDIVGNPVEEMLHQWVNRFSNSPYALPAVLVRKIDVSWRLYVYLRRMSKHAHLFSLAHPFMALDLAKVFMDYICYLHELPSTITSDRNPTFISKVWIELVQFHRISVHKSMAYLLIFLPGKATNPVAKRVSSKREVVVLSFNFHLIQAQHKISQRVDQHSCDRVFKARDFAYLKLQTCKQLTFRLLPNSYGPYKVLNTIGAAVINALSTGFEDILAEPRNLLQYYDPYRVLDRIRKLVKVCSYYTNRSMTDDAQLVLVHTVSSVTGSVNIEVDILDKSQMELQQLCFSDTIYQLLYEAQDLTDWMEQMKSELEKWNFMHYVSSCLDM